ncbi:MAG: hypothetical protein ACI9J3_000949 [Parvicellaceae bacterium]|jgi:hypothetical protein
MIQPFVFCDSDRDVTDLIYRMSNLGVKMVGTTNSNRVERLEVESWQLECPWKANDKVILHWKRDFFGDGLKFQDVEVQLSVNCLVVGRVNIEGLLTGRLNKPLKEIIKEEICYIVSMYTGKGESKHETD